MVAAPLALAILAVHLRHSFACARGDRPSAPLWTLLELADLSPAETPRHYIPVHDRVGEHVRRFGAQLFGSQRLDQTG
jgi:hypothetical protein